MDLLQLQPAMALSSQNFNRDEGLMLCSVSGYGVPMSGVYSSNQKGFVHSENGKDVVKLLNDYCPHLMQADAIESGGLMKYECKQEKYLNGYMHNEHGAAAPELFPTIYGDDLEENKLTFIRVLKTCTSTRALEQGKKTHNCIIQSGLEHDTIIANALIHMYVKCGSLHLAHALFEKLYKRSLVTWSTLIAGYTQHGYDMEVLGVFEKMQNEGIEPDATFFTSLLKACLNLGALVQGRKFHNLIIERGCEDDLYIASTLLEIYLECGELQDAHAIFSQAPHRDVVMWNIFISGCALWGYSTDALNLFEQMQMECPLLDLSSFICILKACSGNLSLGKAMDMHTHVIDCGFELDMSVSCSLIDMYVKCGSLESAQVMFNKSPCWDVAMWSALISGHAQLGHGKKAFELLDEMRLAKFEPNQVTYLSILKACSLSTALQQGRLVHGQMIRSGIEMENSIGNALVDMYSKCGSPSEADSVFNRLPHRDVVCWTALIGGYAEFGKAQEAVDIFHTMQQVGINPNSSTYLSILKACCDPENLSNLHLIHCYILRDGLESDTFIGNALIDMYPKCGSLDDSSILFSRLSKKDATTWSILIGWHARNDLGQEALTLFQQMQQESIEPEPSTCIFLLKACSTSMALEYGRDIHVYILERGWASNCFVGCALIDMYAKCGSLSDASMVFRRTPNHDHVMWSSMISGYAQDNNYDWALKYFDEMLKEGCTPDGVTFLCLLSACVHAGLLKEGILHLKSMVADHGIAPTIEHFNTLNDLLSNCGYWNEAEDLLESMHLGPNIIGWTSLLSSCRSHCFRLDIARRCYAHILCLDPGNAAAHVLMSTLYAEAGMVDAAEEVENLRRARNLRKKLAKASIEINKQVYVFTVGDWSHPSNDGVRAKVKSLDMQAREEGYSPNLDVILHPTSEQGKEDALCGHCERLAIAFGLLNSPQGSSIRIAKNLRMCRNCHMSTSITSKVERREIIITDSYCVHRFQDGECSCTMINKQTFVHNTSSNP